MADQYFIKRGETVKGPYSVEKLRALKEAKKLKADDEISQARKGPWDRLGAVYKSILKEGRVVDTEDDVLSDEDDEFVLLSAGEVAEKTQTIKKEESGSAARCPNCGSTQIGGGRAGGVGMAMENPSVDGLFMGMQSQGEFICTCMACGNEWSPARLAEAQSEAEETRREEGAEKRRWDNLGPAMKNFETNRSNMGCFLVVGAGLWFVTLFLVGGFGQAWGISSWWLLWYPIQIILTLVALPVMKYLAFYKDGQTNEIWKGVKSFCYLLILIAAVALILYFAANFDGLPR
jgi:hypothetical protein